MRRPPIEEVPTEYAFDLAGIINALTSAWGERMDVTETQARFLTPEAPRLAFTIFCTLIFTAQLFDSDPEFMHWLLTTSGLLEPDIFGAPNEKVIEALRLCVEELNDEYHSAK